MKILVATPTLDNMIFQQMAGSLMNVVRHTEHLVEWFRPVGPLLAYNRNVAVEYALDNGFDFILFWDADQEIPDGKFLNGLIETAYKNDAMVVGLPVKIKAGTAYNFAMKQGWQYVNATEIPKDIQEVDVIGTGVMLIRTDVFEQLRPPYFMITDTFDEVLERPGFWPEDWNFCEKVKEKGHKVVLDPRFKVRHWGFQAFE